MILNNNLKMAINRLQVCIVPCYESDNILLIFDNEKKLLKYKKTHEYMCPDQILITIEDLWYNRAVLDGLRYKRYHFMIDEEVQNEI